MMIFRGQAILSNCLILVCYLSYTAPAFSASIAWDGSTSPYWSDATNWDSAAPTDNDVLVFGIPAIITNNDMALTGMAIQVNDAGGGTDTVTINGSQIRLTATGVSVTDRDAVINADLSLDTPSALVGFTVDTGQTLTVNGDISGAGGFEKSGAGTVVLTGDNTYLNGTIVMAGTLVGDTNGINTVISVIGGTLVFDQNFDGSHNTNLMGSPAGTIRKQGTGTIDLSDSVSFSGSLEINDGAIKVSSEKGLGLYGSGTGMNISFDGGTLIIDGVTDFNRDMALIAGGTLETRAATTLSGAISGAGSLTKTGAGSLTISGTNTYAGGTVLTEGTLTVQGGSALADTGSVTINGGILDVDDAETIGALSGTGGVVNLDAGLTTSTSTDTTYGGTIQGTGALIKQGTGRLTLTGNHTFTGDTIVNNGILRVNGTLASPVMVGASGILEGLGTSSGTTIVNGVLAPGNSIGTLTTGNLSLAATSVYEVEIDAAGNGDKTQVIGTVDLGNATLNLIAAAGTYGAQGSYLIIDNDGGDAVTGTFGTIISSMPFLTPTVSYNAGDGNDVMLTMTRNDIHFSDVAITDNQKSVAKALETITAQGDIAEVGTALMGLSAPGARNAYDQMSGAGLSSFFKVNLSIATQQMKTIANRASSLQALGSSSFSQWGQGPLLTSAQSFESTDVGPLLLGLGNADLNHTDANWGLWARGVGVWGDRSGDELSDQFTFKSRGTTMGLDNRFTPSFLAGISLGWAGSDIDFDSLDDVNSVKGLGGTFYGAWNPGTWHLSFAAGFSRNDYETRRHIDFGGIDRVAKGRFDGNIYSGYLEATRPIDPFGLSTILRPLVSLQVTHMDYNAYDETGAGSLNLHVDDREETSVVGSLGLAAFRTFHVSESNRLILGMNARWAHEFVNSNPSATTRFAGDLTGAGTFSVKGCDPVRDKMITGLGLSFLQEEDFSAFVNYDVAIGKNILDHNLSFGLRFHW